jgi:hypothetical protein
MANELIVLAKIWRTWNSCALLVGMESDAATIESGMAVPQKIKNRNIV